MQKFLCISRAVQDQIKDKKPNELDVGLFIRACLGWLQNGLDLIAARLGSLKCKLIPPKELKPSVEYDNGFVQHKCNAAQVLTSLPFFWCLMPSGRPDVPSSCQFLQAWGCCFPLSIVCRRSAFNDQLLCEPQEQQRARPNCPQPNLRQNLPQCAADEPRGDERCIDVLSQTKGNALRETSLTGTSCDKDETEIPTGYFHLASYCQSLAVDYSVSHAELVRWRRTRLEPTIFAKVIHDPDLPTHCLFDSMVFGLFHQGSSLPLIQHIRRVAAEEHSTFLGLSLCETASQVHSSPQRYVAAILRSRWGGYRKTVRNQVDWRAWNENGEVIGQDVRHNSRCINLLFARKPYILIEPTLQSVKRNAWRTMSWSFESAMRSGKWQWEWRQRKGSGTVSQFSQNYS